MMRRIVVGSFVLIAACVSPRNASEVKDDVMTVTELGCVLASAITDITELARLCKVAPKLIPHLVDLVGVREGARRAGVVWKPIDGGAMPRDAATE